MKIDIQPITLEANGLQRAAMNFYGYKELFFLMRGKKQESIDWTEKRLLDFLPNITVSEFIEMDNTSAASRFAMCGEAINNGYHPTWTINETDVPKKLSEQYVKRSAGYMLEEAYLTFTQPLVFCKVVK